MWDSAVTFGMTTKQQRCCARYEYLVDVVRWAVKCLRYAVKPTGMF